jgi:biopolymer transport protein ExbD
MSVRGAGLALMVLALLAGCEEKPKTNPFENPAAPKAPPPITETPKPEGPPEITIGSGGPKVGWTNILLEKSDGPAKLRQELTANKEHVADKTVKVSVDRQAKLAWVVEMTRALDETGATGIEISTETRTEFPKAVVLSPLSSAKQVTPCAVVAKVLSERRNAVWHLKGGTAVRSPKGLAGPDQAMTAENLARAAKQCKDSPFVFVSADEDVEWGLVYDLAAVTQTLEDKPFSKVFLLPNAPAAGRPVALP